MRKTLLFFLVAIFATSIAFADNIDKLSAGTKVFLQKRAIGELQDTAIIKKSTYSRPKTVNGVEYINCFINLNNASIAELEALGVEVNGVYEHFVTAKVPVNIIEELTKLGSIKQVGIARNMKVFTDQASSVTNADKVWDGTNYGLPEAYTGKDVVLGIIDDGIEYNHTAFKDSSGNSRVKAVYRPNATSAGTGGSRVTIDGVTLSGYQYTTSAGISALTTDDTSASHGTHTTGCAGGSKVGNYSGMAPEVDLVLCGAGEGDGLTETAILNSAKYIANYAKNVGKPCVISISLGSETGPHDGKSGISIGYDEIAEQYGAVILLAAGNEADCTGYATKTLSSNSDAMAVIHTPISSMSNYGLYIYGVCDVWNSTSDQLKVQVKVLNSSGIAVYTSDAMSNGTISASTLSSYFTSVTDGGIEIAGSVDANNGRYNLNIVPYLGTNKGSYKLAYVITGSAGNIINVFTENNYSQLASSGSISGYTLSKGQNEGTMCDDMTGNKTISVGAMCSRLSVPTNYGSRTTNLSNGSYNQGDIAYFSSYGTDYNGVNHPFITAPGHSVVSSLNRHDTSGYISTSYCSYRQSLGSSTYDYWGWMSGTSMATPISAGVVALYLQANPTLDVDGVKEVIKNTATTFSNPSSPAKQRGNGIINALAGIEYILNNTTTNPLGMPAITNVEPTTTTADVSWTSGENNVGWNLRYRVYVEQENSTPFFESFENGLNEWTLVDTDGDGNNWRQFDPTTFSNSSYTAYDGQYVAMSRSWQKSTALTPDQWMISPQIENLGGTLKYYIMDDGSYQEKYRIYVSTSGTDISSFQPVTEDMYSPASTSWTEVTIDLSQYAGKAGYIGFRHYDCSDEDFMLIDALGLYKGSEGEWIYVNNVTSPYTIDGLTPETTYEVQVQGIGDNGKTSSWTASTIFTTLGGTSLAEIESGDKVGTTFTISDELIAVYADADNGRLWCKDQATSIVATYMLAGQIDFMRDKSIVGETGQTGEWDQSNWVLLKFPEATSENGVQTLLNDAVGKKIKAGTISGVYTDNGNYTIEVQPINGVYSLTFDGAEDYNPNVYCSANFLPKNLNINGNTSVASENGTSYFFMNPKIQEVCEITYAMWDGEKFVAPDNAWIQGAFNIDLSLNSINKAPKLISGNIYRFKGVVAHPVKSILKADVTPSSEYVVYPTNLTGEDNLVTAIHGIYTDGYREVVGVEYVNAVGVVSDRPFQGVNIVVTRYSDGSHTVKKIVK